MTHAGTLSVFVSSTCYDLVDLRYELQAFLMANGFEPRLSEDPMSGFHIEPSADSIESCLANVEAADIVLSIIDRRYGPPLPSGRYRGFSASEAEVRHARRPEHPKPVLFFMRDLSHVEFQQLRNPGFKPRWIEESGERLNLFRAFVEYAQQLPQHSSRSNWVDQFKSAVDLKRIVLKRLVDQFPAKAVAVALQPDRLVRITFVLERAQPGTISGWFTNVGIGPALNITHGWTLGSLLEWHDPLHRGGLTEGERLSVADGGAVPYSSLGGNHPITVACEYDNRFGDRYRVEQEFLTQGSRRLPYGPEKLFVMAPGSDLLNPEWIDVNRRSDGA